MDEHTLCVVYDCPLIDEYNTQQFLQSVSSNLTQDIDHIYLLLNTPGGSINLGIMIYNFLEGLQIKITTHNIGQVDSIGNVVFLAGDERFATASSTFLYHGIAIGIGGRVSLVQLAETLSQANNDQARMTKILASKTNFTVSELEDFYKQGKSLTPAEAKTKKIIENIKDVKIEPIAKRLVIPTQKTQS